VASGDWGVAQAAPAGREPGEVVAAELRCLWQDLAGARGQALDGRWSIQCDDLTTRIVDLSRLAGATPWDEVPFDLVADGTYQGILTAAGISIEMPAGGQASAGVAASRPFR
jgi:hypothetical protein